MDDIKNILSEVQSIIRTIISDDKITIKMDSTAADIKGWDSLAHIRILVSIEKHYSIKFSLSEMQNVKDISAFVKLIKEKIDKSS